VSKEQVSVNMAQLDAQLAEVYTALNRNIITEKRAAELANIAGKRIKGSLGQLEYNLLANKHPKMRKINFFEPA
jgi:hypothetical protein